MLELPVQNDLTRQVQNLVLYVTKDCNLRCTYCFVHKEAQHMTVEVAKKSIDFLLQSSVSGNLTHLDISFFGGEPLLRTDLIAEVVRYCREIPGRSWGFYATTNGTLAGPRVEQLIRDTGLVLLVSMDGDREASRNRPMLSGAESYPKVAANVRKLMRWSPQGAVRVTYTPDDLDLLGRVLHVLELGAPWIYLHPVVEAEWAGAEARLEEAHQALGDWFIAEIRRGRVPPLGHTWRSLLAEQQARKAGWDRPGRPCPLGTELLAVEPDGHVMPCHRYLNRRQEWLGQVSRPERLASRERYTELSALEIPDCVSCEARRTCGGGCRVVAQEGGYGLQGVHPNHCRTLRPHARMVQRLLAELSTHPFFLQTLKRPALLRNTLRDLAQAKN